MVERVADRLERAGNRAIGAGRGEGIRRSPECPKSVRFLPNTNEIFPSSERVFDRKTGNFGRLNETSSGVSAAISESRASGQSVLSPRRFGVFDPAGRDRVDNRGDSIIGGNGENQGNDGSVFRGGTVLRRAIAADAQSAALFVRRWSRGYPRHGSGGPERGRFNAYDNRGSGCVPE